MIKDLNLEMEPKEFIEILNANFLEMSINNMVASVPLVPNQLGIDVFFQIFKCQNCGTCCTTTPDSCTSKYIYFWPNEYRVIKHLLRPNEKGLFKRDTETLSHGYKLGFPCIFHDTESKKCRIYSRRPLGCKMYPLAINPNNTRTLNVITYCPGASEAAKSIWLSWYMKARMKDKLINPEPDSKH